MVVVAYLRQYQKDCVDAFRMECSVHDIKRNVEAKKVARYINRQGRLIDRIIKLWKAI